MNSQKKLIHETDWDVLIVLDACRYDFFEKIVYDFLDGDLVKAKSSGVGTGEWIRNTFTDYYPEIVYVSANPNINSQDASGLSPDRFHKIIDVWKDSWNPNLSTVLPKDIGKETRLARAKYPSKKIVSHFIQPHAPYLSHGPVNEPRNLKRSIDRPKNLRSLKDYFDISFMFRRVIGKIGQALLGERFKLWVRSLGIGRWPVQDFAKRCGDQELKKAYIQNLGFALSEIKKISERMKGKLVISSDHGELLGEDGKYGHGLNHQLGFEVPWFEVDSSSP